MLNPLLASHLDRFPRQSNVAVITLTSKCTIVLVILVMAADTVRAQIDLGAYRILVALCAAYILVFSIQLELGFIVVEIPIFPVTGVVAKLTTCSQRAFMRILFFVARPAVRLGILERGRGMALLALDQNVLSSKREAGLTVIERSLFPVIFLMTGFALLAFLTLVLVIFLMAGVTI